jgi:hypothetical protein
VSDLHGAIINLVDDFFAVPTVEMLAIAALSMLGAGDVIRVTAMAIPGIIDR